MMYFDNSMCDKQCRTELSGESIKFFGGLRHGRFWLTRPCCSLLRLILRFSEREAHRTVILRDGRVSVPATVPIPPLAGCPTPFLTEIEYSSSRGIRGKIQAFSGRKKLSELPVYGIDNLLDFEMIGKTECRMEVQPLVFRVHRSSKRVYPGREGGKEGYVTVNYFGSVRMIMSRVPELCVSEL